jgi:hypothetical protein
LQDIVDPIAQKLKTSKSVVRFINRADHAGELANAAAKFGDAIQAFQVGVTWTLVGSESTDAVCQVRNILLIKAMTDRSAVSMMSFKPLAVTNTYVERR